jgi:hypothetical protein
MKKLLIGREYTLQSSRIDQLAGPSGFHAVAHNQWAAAADGAPAVSTS